MKQTKPPTFYKSVSLCISHPGKGLFRLQLAEDDYKKGEKGILQ